MLSFFLVLSPMPAVAFEKSLLARALHRVAAQYHHFERSLSSVSLVGGFVFDAITLKRIDLFWENFWVVVHLVVVAFCIAWIHRDDRDAASAEKSSHVWLIVLQFAFGGLLSTFMVYYFRSGSVWASWPFYLFLGVAFLANERLKSRFARLEFQLSLFFLSLFCFMIFVVPVVIHSMGRVPFLMSGVLSLVLLRVFTGALQRRGATSFSHSKKGVLISIVAIFTVINALYFLNLIPPIPLELQDAAVCHSVTRSGDGNYLLQSEKQGWTGFFRIAERIHSAPGMPLYFYSAVFSPTSLNTDIIHEWQIHDRNRGWITEDRISLAVRGGRGGGYRTYSVKKDVLPGMWRVNVETPQGALLGRVRFNVLPEPATPVPLETKLKE